MDIKTFEKEVINNEKPVVVQFSASWCGPCKKLTPIMKQALQARDDFKLVHLDVDEAMDVAVAMRIRAVPTVFMFKGGQVIDRYPGIPIITMVNSWLNGHNGQTKKDSEE